MSASSTSVSVSSPHAPSVQTDATPNRLMITLFIMTATVMQVLDTTIANVALPHMQGSLGAAQDTITWVLTSYIVAAAVVTPTTGWLANRLGVKKLLLIAVVVFTVASMLCGIATSLTEMVIFRLLQGVGGAFIVPLGQAILLDINPRERHGQAMAIWGAGVMIGPIMGPTLGGWITEAFDWRWVFYINLPIGILTFFGLLVFLNEKKDPARRFDMLGFILLAVAVGSMQLALDRGELLDWFESPEILVEIALSVGCFWMFVVHILYKRDPFLSPALFKDRNFVIALGLVCLAGILILATMVLLPPMLQNLMGYPVIETGIVLAPRGVGTMLAMIFMGRYVNKIDGRLVILVALLLIAWSLYDMTQFSIDMDAWPIVYTGVIQGVGMGLLFSAMTNLAFTTLLPQHRAEAASLFSLMRNLGTSVGVSLVASLLSRNTQINHAELSTHITPFRTMVDGTLLQLGETMGAAQAMAYLNAEVTRQATMIAILNDFKLIMIMTLAVIPLLLLLKAPTQNHKSEDSHIAMD